MKKVKCGKHATNKQKKQTKKKDSDLENKIIIIQFFDDEVVSEDDVEHPFDFNTLIKVPKKHDFALAKFKIRENNIVYFIVNI